MSDPLGEPLSIEDAAKAYATDPTTDEEPDNGQTSEAEGTVDDADQELQATDEEIAAAEGETEGDPDDKGQAEDETSEEPDSDQGRFVASNGKVRLPDGTVSTVADLIQGNLRDRDYRQKTMEVSEVRKTYETQSSALKQREQQVSERLDYAEKLIQSIVPQQEPDIALMQTDPMGYMQQKAFYDQWQRHLSFIAHERQRTAEEAKSESESKRKEKAKSEWGALLEAAPELKDERRLKAFASDLQTHGAAYKLTPEEIASVPMDHRFAVILKDAIAMRKLRANKTKVAQKVEGKPPVQKGSARLDPARQKSRSANAAMERLNQSGSLKDGVAALLAVENQG